MVPSFDFIVNAPDRVRDYIETLTNIIYLVQRFCLAYEKGVNADDYFYSEFIPLLEKLSSTRIGDFNE